MKHNILMILSCGVPLLLIFLLPAMGMGSGWVLTVAFGAMLVGHMMHFSDHKHGKKGDQEHAQQH